jgi:hypothetical protein
MNSQNVNVNFCPGCGLNIEAHRLAMVYAQERNRLNALVDGNGGGESAAQIRTRRPLGFRELRDMPILPVKLSKPRKRVPLTDEVVKKIRAEKRPGVGSLAISEKLNIPRATVNYVIYGAYDKYHKTKGTKK